MDGAPALFVGWARLRTTSQSRCRSTAPLVGEPLAKRRSFTECQSLPSIGQRRRPPPVAEAGRSCWGRGQQYASKAKRMLGAATRVRSTSGVSARPTLDEQSFFISKTGVPCYRGQQLRNNILLVKLLLISVAGHSFLRYIELSASSRKWPGLPKPLLQGEVARRRRDGEVVQRRACPL